MLGKCSCGSAVAGQQHTEVWLICLVGPYLVTHNTNGSESRMFFLQQPCASLCQDATRQPTSKYLKGCTWVWSRANQSKLPRWVQRPVSEMQSGFRRLKLNNQRWYKSPNGASLELHPVLPLQLFLSPTLYAPTSDLLHLASSPLLNAL